MSSFPPRLFRSFIAPPPLPPTKCYPETLVFHRRLTSRPPALAPRALKSPGANYITWLGQDGWNRAQSSVCLRRNSSCLRACSPSDVNVNKTSLSSFMNFERTLFLVCIFFFLLFLPPLPLGFSGGKWKTFITEVTTRVWWSTAFLVAIWPPIKLL